MKKRWSLLLAAVGLSSVGQATALNVPLDGQQTSMWCWAASGQMVMNYLGATGVQQCKEANLELGRTDCCTSPNSKECAQGGYTQWDKYHFTVDSSPQMSFAQIKNEIDHGRPIEYAWNWDGGGGHVMVAVGYKTVNGVDMVTINDPIPVNMGTHKDITYAAFVSGPGYTHQIDFFNIKDQPVCSSDFHEMRTTDFQACFDYQALHGRYPVTLTTYLNASNLAVMAGSFQAGPSRPVRTQMTAAQFQSYFNTYDAQGYRPSQVTVLPTPTGPLFTAIWMPKDGAYSTQFGLTDATFGTTFNSMLSAGYVLMDLYAYPDGGTKYVATWVKKSGVGYYAYVNMTAADYNANFNQLAQQGYRPIRFNAYTTSAGTRYAAVWQNTGNGFVMYYAMTPSTYQTQYDAMSQQGFRLAELTALNDVLAAVWIK